MRRGWMVIVMGALFVGTLIGVVWARPDRSAQAADATRKITIPAAFFHPTGPGYDYGSSGNALWMNSSSGYFTAPVVFPCLPSVTVEKVTLSVEDESVSDNAWLYLYRTKPKQGKEWQMASVASEDSQPGVVNYTDDSISYPVVWPSQGPYLYLVIQGPDVDVYGVQIEYRRNI